jgi:Protein of unknown function (DUF4245)
VSLARLRQDRRVSEDGRVTDTPTEPQVPPAPAPRARGRETVGDMVRSMALVLVVVAVVVLLTLRHEPGEKVTRVDFSEMLAQARSAASYDVLAPVGLDKAWIATSARADSEGNAVTWHLGFVTPDGHYAAVEQSDGSAAGLLAEHVQGASRSGTRTVLGVPWQQLVGGQPEPRALETRGTGVTTLVTGNASFAELAQLAGALRGS